MEYEKLFSDHMKAAGFDVENGMDIFKSYYAECHEDPGFRERVKKESLRFDPICAAIAHLKTSKYLGLEDKAAYDIRSAWGLTEEEYLLIARKLSSNLKAYHIDDVALPPEERDDTAEDFQRFVKDKATLRKMIIVLTVLFVSSVLVLAISSILCRKEPAYESVDARVSEVNSELVSYTSWEHYSDYSYPHNKTRLDYLVIIESAGGLDPLYGVPSEDLDHLRQVRADSQDITVYKYLGQYYYTRESMLASRPCVRVQAAFGICMITSAFLLIPSGLVYVFYRNRFAQYHNMNEMERERMRNARQNG